MEQRYASALFAHLGHSTEGDCRGIDVLGALHLPQGHIFRQCVYQLHKPLFLAGIQRTVALRPEHGQQAFLFCFFDPVFLAPLQKADAP